MERRKYFGLACVGIGASQALFFLTGIIPVAIDPLAPWIIGGFNSSILIAVGVNILQDNVKYDGENGDISGTYVVLITNVAALILSLTV